MILIGFKFPVSAYFPFSLSLFLVLASASHAFIIEFSAQ